jgi:hypothetical protein
MSMMVIGLSLLILRQRWCCLLYDVYWLPDGCCLGDWNTWNTIPVSEQENTLNNQTLSQTNHWTEQNKTEQTKSGTINWKQTNRHWITECLMKGWIVTVQCPILDRVLNIFVITELTIATLFCLNVNYEKTKVMTRVSLPSQRAHELPFVNSSNPSSALMPHT